MKQFTLTQEYPASPKIGAVVRQDAQGKYHLYNNESIAAIYEKDYIENYPRYWKELDENQYIK